MSRWLKLAKKVAAQGVHQTKSKRLGSVIVKGGKVLHMAANRANPWGHLYNRGKCSEARALLHHKMDFKGATIYVMRINEGCSKPCPRCMQLIKEKEIGKIVYVDENRQVVSERIY